MNKNKILSGGGKNLTGGGKWGWRGREVGGEGEGSGGRGGGKRGERGREVGIGYPPVHPLYTMHGCPICDLRGLLSDAQYHTAYIIKLLRGRERLKKEEQMKNS